MNKYETLKNEMTLALKNGDKLRRVTLGDMVASIDKAATSGKVRQEIVDSLVDEVLTKYQKTVKEMIDTCPDAEAYLDRKIEYKAKLAIVEEFAPKVIDDPEEIEKIIRYVCATQGTELTSSNRGGMMKLIMPALKQSHCDMKVANEVIKNMV